MFKLTIFFRFLYKKTISNLILLKSHRRSRLYLSKKLVKTDDKLIIKNMKLNIQYKTMLSILKIQKWSFKF